MIDDVIIVGGSAAASAAGIYLARRNFKIRILTLELGGEVARSGEIENWPGIIHTTGIELAQQFDQHLRSYQLPIETGSKVEAIDKEADSFVVTATHDGQSVIYQARAIIVATGVHPRELGVLGEKEYRGKGVSYCTVCDGPLFKGKNVVTIGGGNSALESALMLSTFAKQVTLLTINSEMQGEAVLIDKIKRVSNLTLITQAETQKIIGEQSVRTIEYLDLASRETKTIPADGAFIHIGMIPNSNFIPQVEKNQFGEIMTNKLGETSLTGLFAAGDVTDIPFKQIVIAAGEGVVAALQAVRYLERLEASD